MPRNTRKTKTRCRKPASDAQSSVVNDPKQRTNAEDSSKEPRDTPQCETGENADKPQDIQQCQPGGSSRDEPQPITSETPSDPVVRNLSAWERVAMQVSMARSRRKLAQEIRIRVDAIRTAGDVEKMSRIDWIEEAFQITRFVTSDQLNKTRFRVIIMAEDSVEDETFLASVCFGKHEFNLSARVKPGQATCMTSKYTGVGPPNAEAPVPPNSTFNLIIGKVKQNEHIVFETASMLRKMVARIREIKLRMESDSNHEKIERIAVRLPHSFDEFTGRKIVECAWKDLSVKVDYCVRRKELRESAPRSRLCNVTIRAGAMNVLAFQSIFDRLKAEVRPSAHGIEVHKVMHTDNGDILLRIKENKQGGRESYACEIRQRLGLTSSIS